MIEQLAILGQSIADALKERGEKVAVIDGATGGLISAGIIAAPGATKFYGGGGPMYSLKGREHLFGLTNADFVGITPVTVPYVLIQARAARRHWGAEWALAEAGSAGPGLHPSGPQAGLSCVAIVGPNLTVTTSISTGHDERLRNMETFATTALTLLRDALRNPGAPGSGANGEKRTWE